MKLNKPSRQDWINIGFTVVIVLFVITVVFFAIALYIPSLFIVGVIGIIITFMVWALLGLFIYEVF